MNFLIQKIVQISINLVLKVNVVNRKNENSVKIIKLFLYLQLIKEEKKTTAFQSLTIKGYTLGLEIL